jgi:mannose-6-phosphate isomerase-like protein (cupin superfamily)
MRIPLLLLFPTLALCIAPAWAQESTGTTTVISGAALDALLQQTEGDNPLRVVDSPDGQYGVFVLSSQPRSAPADGTVSGGYHSAVAEIYHVVRGTGIFVTGGDLIDPVAVEADTARYTRAGPGESGRLNNAELVEYGPGSIFIVPPGVPHNATHAVTSDTDFLIYRFDPTRVLPQF